MGIRKIEDEIDLKEAMRKRAAELRMKEIAAKASTENITKERLVELAKKHRLPVIGTSDCHMFDQLNHTYTMIDAEKNIDSVFEALRKRKTRLVTEPLPFFKAVKIITLLYFKY